MHILQKKKGAVLGNCLVGSYILSNFKCFIYTHSIQIISHFDFLISITFGMYVDLIYILRCIARSMNLKKSKQLIIWNGGRNKFLCQLGRGNQ